MERHEFITTLASYVPDVILRRFARDPRPPSEPLAEKFTGPVLIADVSGFTTITEALVKRGAIGAELLKGLLNEYFGRVIGIITAHGGDVVRFAGDAVLAAWYADTAAGLSDLTARAVHCGLALQAELHDYPTREGPALSLKIGIGAGEFVILHLGGVGDRWDFLVSGPAFVQSFTALDRAGPGQVVASLRAWSHVSSRFTGQQLPMGSVLVRATHAVTEPREASLPAVTEEMAQSLGGYIPGAVTSCLAAGHEDWLGELRVVSSLFINLPELNYATPLARAQQIMRDLQTELYHFEGSINKLNVDDKGTSLLAALGLPPMVHDDDAKRAVQAGMAIAQKLGALGLRSSIGIATGRVFCGAIGSPRRREYTLLGDSVNLAARLMQAALGDVLCDEATCHMTRSRIEFERLPEVLIKGKSEPVTVHRPVEHGRPTAVARGEMVGRQRERAVLAERLRALVAGAETAVVIVEGEAGIGKSRLVADLLDKARAFGVTSFVGAGDAVEASTLYYAWRPVFQQLLGLGADETAPEARRQHILRRLASDPETAALAPLLEAVLPCGLTDNEVTAHMTGQVRGENTRNLLLRLLTRFAAQTPTLVILDDAHWQDSASWALTSQVSRQIPSILLLLSTRPFTQSSPAEFNQLLRAASTTHLRLDKLAPEDTAQLLCRSLGASAVPENVAALIHDKGEGNPLFVEELAYALRDGGLLQIEGGKCRLAAALPDWTKIGLPETLHGVIASRIDRLGTTEQLAVKVASVLGQHFRYRALHDNYPVEQDRPMLREHLLSAQQADIIGLDIREPEPIYLFRHVMMQQVAYELLLFEQRQQLHHTIAEWYEKSYADNLAQHYPFLAYHWRHAGEPAKAIEYLEKAGEQSLASGGYSEAAAFLGDALSLDAEAGLRNTPFRRARWERQLGEAYLGLGRLPESRDHLHQALQLLRRPAPATPAAVRSDLLGHMARQLARRIVRGRSTAATPQIQGTSDSRIEAARTYERLAEIYYLSNEKTRLLHALLATLNLTESAGPSPELARAYANTSCAAGLSGLHRLARAYGRDALATANAVGDPVATAWVLLAAGIYALGMGQTAEAQHALAEAISLYRRIGDWQHWGICVGMIAQATYSAGDLPRGLELWNELYTIARGRGDTLQQAWALNGQADGLLKTGDGQQAGQAAALMQTALELFKENIDKVAMTASYGLLALAHLRHGDYPDAWQAAEEGMHLVDEIGSPTGYYMLAGYAGAANTYLALWETDNVQPREVLADKARHACQALDRYARTFALGQPSARLCDGRLAWLAGRRKTALKAWSNSLLAADRLGMPFDQALAHLEIGQHLPNGDPERREHLTNARNIFSQVKSPYYLAQVEQLLNSP